MFRWRGRCGRPQHAVRRLEPTPQRAGEVPPQPPKERARAGESKTASRTSTQDKSSSQRGGQRSHSGSQGPTYDQLYEEAKRRNIDGRSSMNKAQLKQKLGK
ncbi:plasmid stabilization protein [Streptomyces kaempferi]